MEFVPGRYLVGRAPHCWLWIDDPAVEPHHVLVEIDDAGASVTQLAGRSPIGIDGMLVASGRLRRILEVGDSRLELQPSRVSDPGHIARDRSHLLVRAVSLGVGSVRGAIDLEAGWTDGVPVTLDLDLSRPHNAIGIVDDSQGLVRAHSVVRSLDAQARLTGIDLP